MHTRGAGVCLHNMHMHVHQRRYPMQAHVCFDASADGFVCFSVVFCPLLRSRNLQSHGTISKQLSHIKTDRHKLKAMRHNVVPLQFYLLAYSPVN